MRHCIGTQRMKYIQRETDLILGENIAKVRKELGITQEDLAKQLGVSRRALCSYECGKCSIPVFLLPKLSNIFNVPVGQLLNIKNSFFSLDERTKKARLLKELEKVEKLPSEEQKAVFTLIDSLAGKQVTQ